MTPNPSGCCNDCPLLFNTGENQGSTCAADDHWTETNLITNPHSAWVIGSNSRWLSSICDNAHGNDTPGLPADAHAEFSFKLNVNIAGAVDLDQLYIYGRCSGDNYYGDVLINGDSVLSVMAAWENPSQPGRCGANGISCFLNWISFTFPPGHWQTGDNEIEFKIINYSGPGVTTSPMGLIVEWTGCSSS